MLSSNSFGFIGGGNMAEAIIRGLTGRGINPDRITVSDPLDGRRELLSSSLKVRCTSNNRDASLSDIVILAIKPQMAPDILKDLDGVLTSEKLVISIMAGITTDFIEKLLQEGARVVRAMPNTPALVLAGATAICPGKDATADDIEMAEALFSMIGIVSRVNEKQMDAVTGLSGSGPAYAYSFIEALADAGVKNGLPRDTALALSVQTVLGSAMMIKESGEHPAVLRDRVSSPGGTTIAGMHALENGRFHGLVMDAVDAAVKRSKDLAGQK